MGSALQANRFPLSSCQVLGAFWELFRAILGGIFGTIERRKQKRPRSLPLEPARAGSTSARSKIEGKAPQKRLNMRARWEGGFGANFLGSEGALGLQNGALGTILEVFRDDFRALCLSLARSVVVCLGRPSCVSFLVVC